MFRWTLWSSIIVTLFGIRIQWRTEQSELERELWKAIIELPQKVTAIYDQTEMLYAPKREKAKSSLWQNCSLVDILSFFLFFPISPCSCSKQRAATAELFLGVFFPSFLLLSHLLNSVSIFHNVHAFPDMDLALRAQGQKSCHCTLVTLTWSNKLIFQW